MKKVTDISCTMKRMNYVLPTYKIEGKDIIQEDNVTIRFCGGKLNNPIAIKQKGIDIRSLILLGAEYLQDINSDDIEVKESILELKKIYTKLKDKQIIT